MSPLLFVAFMVPALKFPRNGLKKPGGSLQPFVYWIPGSLSSTVVPCPIIVGMKIAIRKSRGKSFQDITDKLVQASCGWHERLKKGPHSSASSTHLSSVSSSHVVVSIGDEMSLECSHI